MGRYVHGSKGFAYKYVFGRQDNNVDRLAEWSGIEQLEQQWSLATQLFLPFRESHEETMLFVTGVAPVTCVYQATIPPFDLIADVEDAIYQVGDDWKGVIGAIDEALPGPAINPDVNGGRSFAFEKRDWETLAKRVGHGADPSAPETLVTARKLLFDSGQDDHLPYMAVVALMHAIEHDTETFVMVDDQPRQTNLWSVVEDYAGAYDPAAPWEDRLLHARLYTFQQKWGKAEPLLRQLLAERPAEMKTAQVLFAGHVRDEKWSELFDDADRLLGVGQPSEARAELLRWRGEAAWCLDRMDEARADAMAAAELGRDELLKALNADPNE